MSRQSTSGADRGPQGQERGSGGLRVTAAHKGQEEMDGHRPRSRISFILSSNMNFIVFFSDWKGKI